MLKQLLQLLGPDAPVLRRYLHMAVFYGLLSGLTIASLAPTLAHLLAGDLRATAGWLVLLALGMVACWHWRRRVDTAGVAVGVALLQGARHRVGDHVARLPLGWFTPAHTARIAHVLTQGMMAVAQLPAHVLTPVVTGVVTPGVVALVLLAWQPTMGLLALCALPLLAAVAWCTQRLGRSADRAFQAGFADASQRMVEFARAQPVLRAFGGKAGAARFLDRAVSGQSAAGRRLIGMSTLSVVLNGWALQAVFAGLFLVALQGLTHGGASPEGLVSWVVSLLLARRYIEPLLDVAAYGEILRGARGQLDAVRDIFATEPLPEPLKPLPPRDASVDLRNVRFRYAPGEPEVLRGVSLRIPAGSMTALVGASGSGKTTLVRLIARFFDVDQGGVSVGGVDVRQIGSAPLAGQISQIFQDTSLFAGSIADNIRSGRPEADDRQVREAAEQAGLADIAARLPQGLDTQVGEGGARLSGGERQRVAIARALIKDAPILLVDEATAALDAENQAVIAQTLARLRGRRTLIVIAHQLSTVAMADQIVVLDEGRVCEAGPPAHLRALGGRYAQFLAQRQAAKGWRLSAPPQPH